MGIHISHQIHNVYLIFRNRLTMLRELININPWNFSDSVFHNYFTLLIPA